MGSLLPSTSSRTKRRPVRCFPRQDDHLARPDTFAPDAMAQAPFLRASIQISGSTSEYNAQNQCEFAQNVNGQLSIPAGCYQKSIRCQRSPTAGDTSPGRCPACHRRLALLCVIRSTDWARRRILRTCNRVATSLKPLRPAVEFVHAVPARHRCYESSTLAQLTCLPACGAHGIHPDSIQCVCPGGILVSLLYLQITNDENSRIRGVKRFLKNHPNST